MALLPSAFFSFSFWCRYLLSLGTENVKTKRCKKKYLLTYCLFYSFFFPYKIYCGDFFLRELSLMSAVLKFSFLVENLHTVM